MIEKYFTWKIDTQKMTANRIMPDGNNIQLKIKHAGDLVEYETEWGPQSKANDNLVIISGVCLWDYRWKVQFKPIKNNPSGAVRCLWSHLELQDALQKIKVGSLIQKISVPDGLNIDYHEKLVDWQAKVIKSKFDREVPILYHLPLKEYTNYIKDLSFPKEAANFQIKELINFYTELKDYVEKSFRGRFITWLDPLNQAYEEVNKLGKKLKTTRENASFTLPYVRPEIWVPKANSIVGIEDLIEFRLSYEARKIRNLQRTIKLVILGLPHPVMNKIGMKKDFYFS